LWLQVLAASARLQLFQALSNLYILFLLVQFQVAARAIRAVLAASELQLI